MRHDDIVGPIVDSWPQDPHDNGSQRSPEKLGDDERNY